MNLVGFYVCLYVAMDKGKGLYQNRLQQLKLLQIANGKVAANCSCFSVIELIIIICPNYYFIYLCINRPPY